MAEERLGLIYELFLIVNQNKPDDPEYVLAKYFLENYTKLGKMNIYDLADACYVSRSSIRRFCQRIGYDNFKDLKDEFKEFNYQYNYFMNYASKSDFRSYMAEELQKMVKELDHRLNMEEMERIADAIHNSKNVVFLSSYSSIMCLMEFQRPLILSGKLVRIMTDLTMDDRFLSSLTEEDYVMTVSATGNFARVMQNKLETVHAYKSLLTASRKPDIEQLYNTVYHLSKEDYSDVKSVYGKYGLEYFFDVLYNTYARKYGTKIP